MPPGPSAPTGANNNGSTTGSLGSGALGTLGTNVLQQDLDSLNRSVQELTTAVNTLSQSMQTGSQFGGSATKQQGPANNNSGFPSMINPSRMGSQTSGGNGGYGSNISGMTSGGYSSNRSLYSGNGGFASGALAMVGAVAGYGASQSQNLVGLNSYATQSLIGYNYNGISQNQAMNQLYGQAGAMPNQQLSIGTGNMQDNLQFAQTLQSAAGSQNISQTARGRGALSAAYGFGVTNPNLSAASAASMGAGLYSPMLSYNMARLGYGNTILSRKAGGTNLNAGQSAMAILGGMNLSKATSQQVTAAFASGGAAQQNLNYLLQGTGISSSAMQGYLTDYAQLVNNSKLSSTQANTLMTQAASGSSSQMKSARAQLAKYGISTANNDLSALVQNQASQTGRAGDVASGFNSGLQQSASLLEDFNNALNSLLHGPLGSILGYGGGAAGTIAGSALGSGANMLGTAGSYMMLNKLMSRSAAKSIATDSADTLLEGGSAGVLSKLGLGGGSGLAGGLGVAAALYGLSKTPSFNKSQPQLNQLSQFFTNKSAGPGGSTSGWNSWNQTGKNFGNWLGTDPKNWSLNAWHSLFGGGNSNPASTGGGATGVSSSTQQRTGGNTQSGSVSGAARKAVSAAESQAGVAYKYGAEIPGVGFDCSALIQWAYKQAGVSLPRTSQSQWSSLSKRSVPLDKVQEGDLVFAAGSDGTGNAPGHVGMMVSPHQVIQAPYTGADIKVSAYNQGDWQHAARPSGSGSFIAGATASSVSGGSGVGNTGASKGISGSGGAYGSVNELDVINAMGGGGRGGSVTTSTGASNGTSGSKNTVTGGSGGGSTSVPPSASSMVAIARQIARKYGWSSGVQWDDFVKVENREAGWNLRAQNPSSRAYGVGQFINGPSDYYKFGGNPNNAQGQFTAMFRYIKQRYGSPAGAWAQEQKVGWYGAGGSTLPGLAMVGERGPELMMQGGGNQVFSNSQTMQLINAIRGSSPAQTPWKTDMTSNSYKSSSSSAQPQVNISFGTNSIVVNAQGNSTQQATQSAQEIQRQISRTLGNSSIHQAIRNGDKL